MFRNRVFPAMMALGVMAFLSHAHAADLVLAEGGQSNYQVVLPESYPHPVIEEWLRQAGRLIQTAFEANGAELPVVVEGEGDPARASIYLGDTRFAREQGVDVSEFSGYDYLHRAVGEHLILAGSDRMPPQVDTEAVGYHTDFLFPRVGTVKAVTDFLREYAGVRFLFPDVQRRTPPGRVPSAIGNLDLRNTAAIEYLSTPEIRVPADLDRRQRFAVRYNATHETGRRQSLWDIANNFFPFYDEVYFAHSWDMAVPPDDFYDEHPDYFALRGGRREKGHHYCLSNPGFQERVYQWHLNWLEQGLGMVSILQQDGFRPCQCDACHALYGTGDDWPEKLWIFHRKLAERFKEEMPDKLIMLVPYALTSNPPKTFDAFPDNVVIHIIGAGTNQGDFEQWSEVDAPGGFSAKPHNWITNQSPRYTPIRTPRFMEAQQKRLYKFNTHGIARDFGNLGNLGLSGPTFYVLGNMWRDPENTRASQLVLEYVEGAFGEAAGPMRRFYDQLYHAVEPYSSFLGTRNPGWTYTDIYGRRHKLISDPFRMLGLTYTPSLLDSLEEDLSRAEQAAESEKAKNRLDLVRREFTYLKQLANVVHLYHAHRVAPDDEAVYSRLLDAIDERNDYIDNYLYADGQRRPNPGMPLQMFPPSGHFASHLRLEQNLYQGRWADTALNWDTAARREAFRSDARQMSVGRVTEPPTLADDDWESAQAQTLVGASPGSQPPRGTVLKALYDDENLYIRFESELPAALMEQAAVARRGDALRDHESVDVYLRPDVGEEYYYRFVAGASPQSRCEAASGFIDDPMNLLYGKDDPSWSGAWRHEARLEPERGRWLALVAIPFETLGVEAPTEGSVWQANFGRTHRAADGRVRHSIWSPTAAASGIEDRSAFGRLVFEGLSERARLRGIRRQRGYDELLDQWTDLPNLRPEPLRDWAFRTDPMEQGGERQWYSRDTDESGWSAMPAAAWYAETPLGRYYGYAWYRTRFEAPAEWAGKRIRLLFAGVDEQAWVYVNGALVGEHTEASEGAPSTSLWERPFVVEVPPERIEFGGSNLVAVRVYNTAGQGGIYRPVFVHAAD